MTRRIQHSEMFLYASSRARAMSFLLVRLSALLFSMATSANRMMITDVEESDSGKAMERDGGKDIK